MKTIKLILAISFISGTIMTVDDRLKKEDAQTKLAPIQQKTGLITKAGFDVDKLVTEAHKIEEQKNLMHDIVDASIKLIGEMEVQYRDKLFRIQKEKNLSKQQIEDELQNYIMHELTEFSDKLLNLNKSLARDVIQFRHEPTTSIN